VCGELKKLAAEMEVCSDHVDEPMYHVLQDWIKRIKGK
jgi:hypothetical protein